MTERVSPIERIRADIDDLFASEGDLGEALERVARLGARLLLQSALEAEVTEFLGRNRYERRRLAREAKAGSRNGFAPFTVKSTAGPITLERPKLRGTTEAFASRLLGTGVTKTNALESLVIAGFVRGLSHRDVEAALAEALGPEATVSRSTVSRICEAIKEEFASATVMTGIFFPTVVLLSCGRLLGHPHLARGKAQVGGPPPYFNRPGDNLYESLLCDIPPCVSTARQKHSQP